MQVLTERLTFPSRRRDGPGSDRGQEKMGIEIVAKELSKQPAIAVAALQNTGDCL